MLHLFKKKPKPQAAPLPEQPQPVPEGRLLSIKDAAQWLGLPVYTVRQLIWAGDLPFLKNGEKTSKIWIDRNDLELWIKRGKQYHD